MDRSDCLPLAAACDVLAHRALELIGKRIARSDRSRIGKLGDLRWADAHTVWEAEPETVEKVLASAWASVPELLERYGCLTWDAEQLVLVLNRYVHDCVHASAPHDPEDLAYRLGVQT